MNIEYKLFEDKYYDGVVGCIAESFSKYDVLGTALNIDIKDWIDFSSEAASKANKEISFIAIANNNIIGAHLSTDFNEDNLLGSKKIKSFLPIYELMDSLHSQYRVGGRVLHFSYVGVDENYLRQGVAFEMATKNISLAKIMGYDKIILEATSPYSQINVHKLGFKKVGEIFYDTFEYGKKRVFSEKKGSCMLMELSF